MKLQMLSDEQPYKDSYEACSPRTPTFGLMQLFNVQGWLEADRDWSYFEKGSTAPGSVREEGEEEQRSEGNNVDPQDRDLHRNGRDARGRDADEDGDPRRRSTI